MSDSNPDRRTAGAVLGTDIPHLPHVVVLNRPYSKHYVESKTEFCQLFFSLPTSGKVDWS